MSNLTAEDHRILAGFDEWLKKLFNAKGFLHIKPVAFSTQAHTDAFGSTTIDSGRMTIQREREKIIIRASDGTLVAAGFNITSVLLDALINAINRHFANHHSPQ